VGWLAKTIGLEVQLLDGGYKRFRNWALALFEQQWPLQILGGGTGSGKTEVLQAIAQKGGAMVDLEALASHRGSSFGALGLPAQPSSEHFENCLAICLHKQQGKSVIWLEAESAQVGRCRIPNGIWSQMQTAPLVLLERPKPERINLLVEVYGRQEIEGLIEATQRLSRRLGPQRTAIAVANIRNGNLEAACAEILDYYDRYYIKELQKRQMGFKRIAGEGKNAETIAEMLMQLEGA
jgi:tRNA 2-selenouridine synthase